MNSEVDSQANLPTIFVICGGLGTRLGKLGEDKPKSMVSIAGKPFIDHQLRLLKNRGFENVILCTGHLGEQIKQYVGTGDEFDLKVRYSDDEDGELVGTGGAIKKALAKFNHEQFAIIYGDSYLDVQIIPIYQAFLQSNKIGLMSVLRNENRWGRSNLKLGNGLVTYYDKGCLYENLQYIDFGLTFMHNDIFQKLEEKNFNLSLIWTMLIDKKQLAFYEVQQRFYEIGNPSGISEAEVYISGRK
jgi:N-acetyl-alpha-D-muramate 1-phosphate uridylyltransferase